MATLYAGPWIGEFGWELMWWNPSIRAVAANFDKVTVASHRNSEWLYEFADEFIPLDAHGWSQTTGVLRSGSLPSVTADTVIDPKMHFKSGYGGRERAFRNLAGVTTRVADVLCAFRPPKVNIYRGTANGLKSYPDDMAAELVSILVASGLSVACFGNTDNRWFPGAADLRGWPLGQQCSALGGALCALGPSSGTIHLASLCGCPHVTWYTPRTHPHLKRRYEVDWNPLQTACRFLVEGPPSPRQIVDAVLDIIRHAKKNRQTKG